jgi:V-type H+-transporting ATPase subunit a
MFGDIAHGGVILALGIYLVLYNDKIKKSSMSFVCDLRYIILMMGFFAFYCGWVYNDFIGMNLNIFGSCYNVKDAIP